MDPRDELDEEVEPLEELSDEPEEELIEEPGEEINPEEEQVYDDYSSPFEQTRDNIRQSIKNRIQNKKNGTDDQIKEKIEKGRQQNLKQKSVREAKKREEQIAKKTAKEGAKKAAEEGTKKVAKEGTKKAAGEAAKAAANAIGAALKAAAQAIGSAISSALASLLANPYFWIVVGVILLIIVIIVLVIVIYSSVSGDAGGMGASYKEVYYSRISLTHTDLTKTEFVEACNKKAEQYKNKTKIGFYEKCDLIYDISIRNNFNPEMVVIRAAAEGYSPATDYPEKNNYWGIGCYNGASLSKCTSYSTFEAGVIGYIKNVKRYDTVEDMMKKYAYIGDYWYNPGDSGKGGCYYYPYIKEYMTTERANVVASYCVDTKRCSGSKCSPTNSEDQDAYSKYQVNNMVKIGNEIFGSVTEGIPTGDSFLFDIRTQKPNWLLEPDSQYYDTSINGNYYFQCVWYAKARAIEMLNNVKIHADKEKVETAIEAIKNSNADGGGWYQLAQDNGSMSIFKSSNNIKNARPGAMISWKWNNVGCANYHGTKCDSNHPNYGHVGIIEDVDRKKKTVILTEGWHVCDDWNNPDCFAFNYVEVSLDDLAVYQGDKVFLGYVYILDYLGG